MPQADPPGVTRILVATDRSATAEQAVAFAVEMAERYAAELVLLQVIVPAGGAGSSAGASGTSELGYATKALEMRAHELAGERGRALVVIDDDPAAAIVEAVEEESVDVVVVGNAGMSGRKELLLANVPNRVSHNAACTVIIVNTATSAQPPRQERLDRLRRLVRRET